LDIKQAFIIHGSNGSPEGHWLGWLAGELKRSGYMVIAPQFPIGKQKQFLKKWLATLEPFKEALNGAIIIGHSLGVPFILNVLSLWDVKLEAAFLVSGFTGCLAPEVKATEYNIDDFSCRPFDWNLIRSRSKQFEVFHSDNDPYIPLKNAEEYAEKLGTIPFIIKGGAHITIDEGFSEFPFLLQRILILGGQKARK
jgi:uncharacterized protein